ncbi:MAG: DUF6266 family protein [Bacteroidota bacterium]
MKHGPYGPIEGRLGNTVGYIRLGQPVVRMMPKKLKRKKKGTEAQVAARTRFALVTDIISSINAFTNAGFKLKAKSLIGKTAQNMAMSVNLKNVVTGEYPNYQIDYTKLQVAEGDLSLPVNPTVVLEGNILKYNWEINPYLNYVEKTSQMMVLAYLPALKKAYYLLGTASRYGGEGSLEIPLSKKTNDGKVVDLAIECYMAFVSQDRERISNSIYLGQVAIP